MANFNEFTIVKLINTLINVLRLYNMLHLGHKFFQFATLFFHT